MAGFRVVDRSWEWQNEGFARKIVSSHANGPRFPPTVSAGKKECAFGSLMPIGTQYEKERSAIARTEPTVEAGGSFLVSPENSEKCVGKSTTRKSAYITTAEGSTVNRDSHTVVRSAYGRVGIWVKRCHGRMVGGECFRRGSAGISQSLGHENHRAVCT